MTGEDVRGLHRCQHGPDSFVDRRGCWAIDGPCSYGTHRRGGGLGRGGDNDLLVPSRTAPMLADPSWPCACSGTGRRGVTMISDCASPATTYARSEVAARRPLV